MSSNNTSSSNNGSGFTPPHLNNGSGFTPPHLNNGSGFNPPHLNNGSGLKSAPLTFLGVISGMELAVGLIFNSVILILNVIIIIKTKVSVAHILITVLHGFDLVICMTSLPLTFVAAILDIKLFLICVLHEASLAFSVSASSLLLQLLTFERYDSIIRPFQPNVKKGNIKYILATVTVFSTVPFVISLTLLNDKEAQNVYQNETISCVEMKTKSKAGTMSTLICLVFYIMANGSIIYFYHQIMKVARTRINIRIAVVDSECHTERDTEPQKARHKTCDIECHTAHHMARDTERQSRHTARDTERHIPRDTECPKASIIERHGACEAARDTQCHKTRDTGHSNSNKMLSGHPKLRKLIIKCVLSITLFWICWGPYSVLNMIFLSSGIPSINLQNAYMFSLCLGHFSCILHPVIYSLVRKTFRDSVCFVCLPQGGVLSPEAGVSNMFSAFRKSPINVKEVNKHEAKTVTELVSHKP